MTRDNIDSRGLILIMWANTDHVAMWKRCFVSTRCSYFENRAVDIGLQHQTWCVYSQQMTTIKPPPKNVGLHPVFCMQCLYLQICRLVQLCLFLEMKDNSMDWGCHFLRGFTNSTRGYLLQKHTVQPCWTTIDATKCCCRYLPTSSITQLWCQKLIQLHSYTL